MNAHAHTPTCTHKHLHPLAQALMTLQQQQEEEEQERKKQQLLQQLRQQQQGQQQQQHGVASEEWGEQVQQVAAAVRALQLMGRPQAAEKLRRCAVVCISHSIRVGQNHIYTMYMCGICGREITKYTVVYGVYIWFWPTLHLMGLI